MLLLHREEEGGGGRYCLVILHDNDKGHLSSIAVASNQAERNGRGVWAAEVGAAAARL